jgi:hypothetical protein
VTAPGSAGVIPKNLIASVVVVEFRGGQEVVIGRVR